MSLSAIRKCEEIIYLLPLGLAAVRILHFILTGFLLPDEALYYTATHEYFRSGRFVLHFLDRVGYQIFVYALCRLLDLHDVWRYVIGFSLLSALWLTATLILIADMNSTHAAFLAAMCPVFLLLAPTVLSENVALFFTVAGIYLLYKNREESHIAPIVSAALALGIASLIREPYTILLVGNVAYLLLSKRNRAGLTLALSSLPFLLLAWNWSQLRTLLPPLLPAPSLPVETISIHAKQQPNALTEPLSLTERLTYSTLNTSLAFATGLGFVSILIVASLVGSLRQRKIDLLNFNAILCLLSVVGAIFWTTRVHFYTTPLCLLTIVRLSHTALPAVLAVSKPSYRRFPFQILIIVFMAILVLASGRVPLTESPWLRMARLCQQTHSKIIIYGEPVRRLMLFLPEDVVVKAPREEMEFRSFLKTRWTRFYLYGELHPLHWQALRDNCPWYYRLVRRALARNSTYLLDDYEVKVVWRDESSYCLEVRKI